MVDLTRNKKFAEKKTISISAARILHGDVSATSLNELFNLPANCLITRAGVAVHSAGQGGLTVNIGFAGGSELGSAIPLDGTGYFDADAVSTLTDLTGTMALTSGAGTIALTSGAGTGVIDDLTGVISTLTLNEAQPNTLNAGTITLSSAAVTNTLTDLTGTGVVADLTGTCVLTSGAGTVVAAPRILTTTGKNITATFSADPTAGDFSFIVEYIEFELGNGNLTELTA